MARINVPFVQGQIDLDMQGRTVIANDHRWKGTNATGGSIQYQTGDVVVHNDRWWISASDDNDNNEPGATGGTSWTEISEDTGSIIAANPTVADTATELTSLTIDGTDYLLGGGPEIEAAEPPASAQDTGDQRLRITVDNRQYYVRSDIFSFVPITLAQQTASFNIGDTLPANLTYTFNAVGGNGNYTYTTDTGSFSANVLTVPSSTATSGTNAATTTNVATVTVFDDQATPSRGTSNAVFRVTDNRRFTFFSPTSSVSRFTTGSWSGSFSYVNIPTSIPTLSTSQANPTITRNAISIPYASFTAGSNTITTTVAESRTGITTPLAGNTRSATLEVYTPGAFYGSGVLPTTGAGVTAGTEVRDLSSQSTSGVGITNAATGNNWIATTSATSTFELFVGGSFMGAGAIPAPTTVTATDAQAQNVTYYVYNIGGVGAAGSTLTVRIT